MFYVCHNILIDWIILFNIYASLLRILCENVKTHISYQNSKLWQVGWECYVAKYTKIHRNWICIIEFKVNIMNNATPIKLNLLAQAFLPFNYQHAQIVFCSTNLPTAPALVNVLHAMILSEFFSSPLKLKCKIEFIFFAAKNFYSTNEIQKPFHEIKHEKKMYKIHKNRISWRATSLIFFCIGTYLRKTIKKWKTANPIWNQAN